jgi:hypothetical protein
MRIPEDCKYATIIISRSHSIASIKAYFMFLIVFMFEY